jgi:hypothetical protein
LAKERPPNDEIDIDALCPEPVGAANHSLIRHRGVSMLGTAQTTAIGEDGVASNDQRGRAMPYVIRSRIAANRGNVVRAGIYTYLAETGDHFYIWDGVHKAAHFKTAESGLEAADQCNAPWSNLPDPATVEGVIWAAR